MNVESNAGCCYLAEAFEPLKHLLHIDLFNNPILVHNPTQLALKFSSQLLQLGLGANRLIQKVPTLLLTSNAAATLTTLNLSGNLYFFVTNALFPANSMPNLSILILESCSVSFVEDDAFIGSRCIIVEGAHVGAGAKLGAGDTLLLATRKLGGIFAARIRQADQRQQFSDPLGDRRFGLTAADQAVPDIVGDSQIGKQRIGLEDDPEVTRRRRQSRNVPALLMDRARGLRVEPGNGAKQSGLAAARGTEKAHELALGDVERDVAQRREIAEALVEIANLEIRRH